MLLEKGPQLSGILNGVDYSVWSPRTDPLIAATYSPDDLAGKADCKEDIQRLAGLPLRPDAALIGMVSRLSSQKGVDILSEAFDSLMDRDVQVLLLGTGEARYQAIFKELKNHYPDQTGVFLSYDYGLAHKIFAGSDMILVPSRYEPCGLNQLYALKYGTVPIVRATGGLTDTVEEFDAKEDSGTGFRFTDPDPFALATAIFRALDLFSRSPHTWKRLMVRGMKKDFSWKRSAEAYIRLYEQAVARRKQLLSPR